MKIELIYQDGNLSGYDMIPENEEDREVIGAVRDLNFWGIDETVIRYNGRLSDEEDNILKLRWRQKRFLDKKQ